MIYTGNLSITVYCCFWVLLTQYSKELQVNFLAPRSLLFQKRSWSRCLIFKVLCFLNFRSSAFLFYHIVLRLSRTFFDFFQNLFCSRLSHFSATAFLLYHIDFALSRTFFIFSWFSFSENYLSTALISRLSGGRQSFSFPCLCDSFNILSHLSYFVNPFFRLFSFSFLFVFSHNFFPFLLLFSTNYFNPS